MHLTNSPSKVSGSLAESVLAGEAGAPATEIEITDEMIDMAVNILVYFDPKIDDPCRVAEEILRASLLGDRRQVSQKRNMAELRSLGSAVFLDTSAE
jgi:hypothetical protein